MRRPALPGAVIVCIALAANFVVAQRAQGPSKRLPAAISAVGSHAQDSSSPDHNALVRRYCVTCHNDARKTGGLSLAAFDVARAAAHADIAEKMIRKLQAGRMPPPLAARPDAAAQAALVAALET